MRYSPGCSNVIFGYPAPTVHARMTGAAPAQAWRKLAVRKSQENEKKTLRGPQPHTSPRAPDTLTVAE